MILEGLILDPAYCLTLTLDMSLPVLVLRDCKVVPGLLLFDDQPPVHQDQER